MPVNLSVCLCVPVYCFVFRNLETLLSCSHNICSTVYVQSSSVCVCVCVHAHARACVRAEEVL